MDLTFSLHHGIRNCQGAEIHILGDDSYRISLLELSLLRQGVTIGSKVSKTVSLRQLPGSILTGPLAVCLTGKGILIKKSPVVQSLTEQNLKQVFPGYSAEKFYVQHFISGELSFIALIRKESLDEILQELKRAGINVLLISLGPFIIDQVLPQLNVYGAEVQFNGHQVYLDEERSWKEYHYEPASKSSFPIKIDRENLAEEYLLAYAAAFQLLLHDRLVLIQIAEPASGNALTELLAEISFKRNLAFLLLLLFFFLLLNFLIFSFYHSANEKLSAHVGQRTVIVQDQQKLETEIKENEDLVQTLGWNRGKNYAYLCDQIAQAVPATVRLKGININGTKPASAAGGQLSINGLCGNAYVMNDFIDALQKRTWVKKLRLEEYRHDDHDSVAGKAKFFKLLLTY